MTDKTGNAVQAEYWVLSSVNGTRYQPLYRTQNGRLSPDRFPRPTARWRRCTQRNQPQGEECDMEVLGQWSDDVSYVRRNSDYASVNCKGMESSSKMDIGGPNSGGVKSVHFNDDNASDSVSQPRPASQQPRTHDSIHLSCTTPAFLICMMNTVPNLRQEP